MRRPATLNELLGVGITLAAVATWGGPAATAASAGNVTQARVAAQS